ncbi:Aste57867_5613 [Aphanomyces stellatus]|uniref:Aste57867_5613 protein n=1 Tax=Aphanomyces stellatus TaxID=120398 RepID=A0A485KD38_9STRA|nr:hypothetical protein As57867_005600 [Aphanomyces stellatus]VFT82659.1 Aste57867_5613 [Aphanomyces stellatus]
MPPKQLNPPPPMVTRRSSRFSLPNAPPTIDELDESLKSGDLPCFDPNGVNDDGNNNNVPRPVEPTAKTRTRVAEMMGNTLVYGDTVALFATPASTGVEAVVGFLPLSAMMGGSAEDHVLALGPVPDAKKELFKPARFVIMPPPGDKNVKVGKTAVHFNEPCVLELSPETISPWDSTTPPPKPKYALNNKLPDDVNDFIGARVRVQGDGGSAKGELHVKLLKPGMRDDDDEADDDLGSKKDEADEDEVATTNHRERVTKGDTNLTLHVIDTNRLRERYNGQDIGHLEWKKGDSAASFGGFLVCGHKKTALEFAQRVRPKPVTFRLGV